MYFDCVWGKEHQETTFESFRSNHGSCFEDDPNCILCFNESKNFVPVSFYFQVKMGFQISNFHWDIWKPDAAFRSSSPEIKHYISWNHPVVWLSLSPARLLQTSTMKDRDSHLNPKSKCLHMLIIHKPTARRSKVIHNHNGNIFLWRVKFSQHSMMQYY